MKQKLLNIYNFFKCLGSSTLRDNVRFLSSNNIKSELYRMKDEAVEDAVYEYEKDVKILRRLDIASPDETLEILEKNPNISFARLGDGEINIINGLDTPFQKYEPDLARKMVDILVKKTDKLFVGLNGAYFDSPYNYVERNRMFYRIYGTGFRRFFLSHCDPTARYLDATCFGAYFRFDESYDYKGHYAKIKKLFAGKKIAIVCGATVFDKIEYDLFEDCADKKMIYGPSINAFTEYDQIISNIQKSIPKNYLICLILGMTATALAKDLSDLGYTAWDIGHIAKDYDCYMKQTPKTKQNMDAFWDPD